MTDTVDLVYVITLLFSMTDSAIMLNFSRKAWLVY